MPYVLALLSAACYGAADFVGGLTARRTSTLAAVLVSQASGLALLVAAMPFTDVSSPRAHDLTWGAAAGAAGGVGVALLYRALAIGTMAVVAPITALCAVAIPVLAGLLLGERLSAMSGTGIGVALIAIVLVSQQRSSVGAAVSPRRGLPPGVGVALLSGIAIGVFYLALARTSRDGGMWPLVAARSASVLFFGIAALAGSTPLRMDARAAAVASGGGALDMLANALYLVATRGGPLAIIVTLSSLYPASTVVLARVVLAERLSRVQVAGIASAFAAVVLIVMG
jgi:uncharacterized membrane protein